MNNRTQSWMADRPSNYQLGDITRFPDWHNIIVWDAFFNNLAAGLMLVIAIVWGAGSARFGAGMIMPIAMTMALAIVSIDLLLLIFDLADSWRFFHALRVMRFTSPLSVGVWGLCSFATFLGVAVVLFWLMLAMPADSSLRYLIYLCARLFTVMAAIGAVVVICYKGVVFSCSSQPGLKDARWLTPFMVSDSLLMGLSLYLLLICALGGQKSLLTFIPAFITLICARGITFGLLWQDVKTRARLVYGFENALVFFMVYVAGGIAAITLCFFGPIWIAAAALIMPCCGLVERYWFVGLPAPVRHRPNPGE